MSGGAWPFFAGRHAGAVLPPAAAPLDFLTTAGRIFLDAGVPWRWKGASQFKLLDRFRRGENIDPVLAAYAGFNVLRVWTYTPAKDWGSSAWGWPTVDETIAFVGYLASHGFRTEITLLTDDDPANLEHAQGFVAELPALPSLMLEGGNEPTTHKTINTAALRDVLEHCGMPYTSGDYEDSDRWFGNYYVDHSLRSDDWTRRAKNIREFYDGSGPDKPTHPHHVACLEDEPGKYQDVGAVLSEWRAYFGNCALMGAGATVHTETGKLAELPTETEKPLIAAALDALNTFPADACNGGYRRIVEPGNEPGGPTENSRTYIVGNYAVRCQQVGASFPEDGWTALDEWGVLWRR